MANTSGYVQAALSGAQRKEDRFKNLIESMQNVAGIIERKGARDEETDKWQQEFDEGKYEFGVTSGQKDIEIDLQRLRDAEAAEARKEGNLLTREGYDLTKSEGQRDRDAAMARVRAGQFKTDEGINLGEIFTNTLGLISTELATDEQPKPYLDPSLHEDIRDKFRYMVNLEQLPEEDAKLLMDTLESWLAGEMVAETPEDPDIPDETLTEQARPGTA